MNKLLTIATPAGMRGWLTTDPVLDYSLVKTLPYKYLLAIQGYENTIDSFKTLEGFLVSNIHDLAFELAEFKVDGKRTFIPRELSFLNGLFYANSRLKVSHLMFNDRRADEDIRPLGFDLARHVEQLNSIKQPTDARPIEGVLKHLSSRGEQDPGMITYAGLSGPFWKWYGQMPGREPLETTTAFRQDFGDREKRLTARVCYHLTLDVTSSTLRALLSNKKINTWDGAARRAFLRSDDYKLYLTDDKLHLMEYPMRPKQVYDILVDYYYKGTAPSGNLDASKAVDPSAVWLLMNANFSGESVGWGKISEYCKREGFDFAKTLLGSCGPQGYNLVLAAYNKWKDKDPLYNYIRSRLRASYSDAQIRGYAKRVDQVLNLRSRLSGKQIQWIDAMVTAVDDRTKFKNDRPGPSISLFGG